MNTLIETIFEKRIFYLFLIFVLSRIFYYQFYNITFDSWTIDVYLQFFPKIFLQNDLINSLIYNHFQPPFLNLLTGSLMKISKHYLFILNGFFYFVVLLVVF